MLVVMGSLWQGRCISRGRKSKVKQVDIIMFGFFGRCWSLKKALDAKPELVIPDQDR